MYIIHNYPVLCSNYTEYCPKKKPQSIPQCDGIDQTKYEMGKQPTTRCQNHDASILIASVPDFYDHVYGGHIYAQHH